MFRRRITKKDEEKKIPFEKNEEPKVTRRVNLSFKLFVGFILTAILAGVLIGAGYTDEVFADREIGQCSFSKNNENFYQIASGYYHLESGEYVYVFGGVASDNDKIEVSNNTSLPSCYFPIDIINKSDSIPFGDKIISSYGIEHIVVFARYGVNSFEEVVPEAETPLP